jgi:hypothetical protein
MTNNDTIRQANKTDKKTVQYKDREKNSTKGIYDKSS